MEWWRRHLSLLSRCNTLESLQQTLPTWSSQLRFGPTHSRSLTPSSAYGSFQTRLQRSFCVLSSFIRSRFWGNRRKPFAVFLAKLGTDIRVESYAYTVQFAPLFKFRSFTTIINIMSTSMEPYRMSRRIDLEPGTSHKYFRFFWYWRIEIKSCHSSIRKDGAKYREVRKHLSVNEWVWSDGS